MSCVGPLQRLVTMFNAPTSLRQQKSVNRRKRAMTKSALQANLAESKHSPLLLFH